MRSTKFLLKLILFIISALFVFCIISAIFIKNLDINKHKDILLNQIEHITGHKIIVNGPIDILFFPAPKIKLNDVNFYTKITDKEFKVNIEDFLIELDFYSLLFKKTQINIFELKNITINFLTNKTILQDIKIDKFSGKLITSLINFQLIDFKLQAGKNDLSGNIDIQLIENMPKIEAQLKSNYLFISNLNISSHDYIFEKFLIAQLNQINANIKYNIETFSINNNLFKNIKSEITNKNKNLAIKLKSTNPINFWGDFNIKLNKNPFITISCDFKIEDKKIENNANGKLLISLSDKISKIEGDIKLQQWILNDSKKILSNNLWFKNIQSDLNFHIDDVFFENIHLKNMHVNLKKENDRVFVPLSGEIFNGTIKANLTFNNVIGIKLEIKNAVASEMIKQFYPNMQLTQGLLYLKFDGYTDNQAGSFKENLTGNTLIHIKDMLILKKNIDSRYVDIFSAFWKKLSPSKESNTLLECAAMRFEIKKGLLQSNNNIAFETREIYTLGTGKADLKTGQLNFIFSLYPRSKLDLEVGALDNQVFLTGTVANPQFKASMQGLAREGGSIILGIATGGVSLLAEKLLKLTTQRSSPCKEVLSK